MEWMLCLAAFLTAICAFCLAVFFCHTEGHSSERECIIILLMSIAFIIAVPCTFLVILLTSNDAAKGAIVAFLIMFQLLSFRVLGKIQIKDNGNFLSPFPLAFYILAAIGIDALAIIMFMNS